MPPDPIPLRTLTVLLNYGRVISDPRFMGVRLMKSSLANPTMIGRMKVNYAQFLKDVPRTAKEAKFNIFEPYTESATSDPPSTICPIHPKAAPNVQALTHKQRELLYHETRGHDGYFKAIGLFQFFFELCPPGQRVLIQLTNEEPVIVDPRLRQIIEYTVHSPKQNSIATIAYKNEKPRTLHTGQKDDEGHGIIVFPNFRKLNEAKECFVVDMSRMQYGEAGRGLHGENYFIGTMNKYLETMKKVCGEMKSVGMYPELGTTGSENEARLRACARKVLERWQNRETESWCNFCGKPGPNLRCCPGCKDEKVGYCCVEHQKSDWKLHKHTCEKHKK